MIRYYQAGIINALFGYTLFSGFVFAGFNIYYAQIASHLCGMTFNYFSYSKHAFKDRKAIFWKFVLSYAVNYFINLSFIFLFSKLVSSPYGVGFAALLATSFVNFFILKGFVFVAK